MMQKWASGRMKELENRGESLNARVKMKKGRGK